VINNMIQTKAKSKHSKLFQSNINLPFKQMVFTKIFYILTLRKLIFKDYEVVKLHTSNSRRSPGTLSPILK